MMRYALSVRRYQNKRVLQTNGAEEECLALSNPQFVQQSIILFLYYYDQNYSRGGIIVGEVIS